MKKIFSICLVLLSLHTLAVERTLTIPGIFTISGKIIPQGKHPRNRIVEFRLNDLLSSDSRKYNGKNVHKNALHSSDGQKTIRAVEQLLN